MKYENTCEGIFIDRPNRFIAHVSIGGKEETVHVKNTGRCREILLPGSKVILEKSTNPNRKTAYDLIMVYKAGLGWINIDSQAPNKLAGEWLESRKFDLIQPEKTYGNSRIDFYLEKGHEKYFMEVKGCTLEINGEGYFPDAPTQRGARHLLELTKAVEENYRGIIAFVIQMEGVSKVNPHRKMDPAFADALEAAEKAGVEILFLRCHVTEKEVTVVSASKEI